MKILQCQQNLLLFPTPVATPKAPETAVEKPTIQAPAQAVTQAAPVQQKETLKPKKRTTGRTAQPREEAVSEIQAPRTATVNIGGQRLRFIPTQREQGTVVSIAEGQRLDLKKASTPRLQKAVARLGRQIRQETGNVPSRTLIRKKKDGEVVPRETLSKKVKDLVKKQELVKQEIAVRGGTRGRISPELFSTAFVGFFLALLTFSNNSGEIRPRVPPRTAISCLTSSCFLTKSLTFLDNVSRGTTSPSFFFLIKVLLGTFPVSCLI